MMRKFLTVLALALLVALPAAADTFVIDKGHSEVSFRIRHLVSNTAGRFDDFSGTIDLDKANLEASSVNFEIVATSINTGVADRDNHLRGEDFFDVAKFPKITFKSKKIKKTGESTYDVTGDFTMHGVTKEITLPVTFLGEGKGMRGNTVAGFETSATLNRKDYGISWNRAVDQGGVILGDDVKISISLETGKQEPAPAAK